MWLRGCFAEVRSSRLRSANSWLLDIGRCHFPLVSFAADTLLTISRHANPTPWDTNLLLFGGIFNIITTAVIKIQILIFLGVSVKIVSIWMIMNQRVKAKGTNGTISVQKDGLKIV